MGIASEIPSPFFVLVCMENVQYESKHVSPYPSDSATIVANNKRRTKINDYSDYRLIKSKRMDIKLLRKHNQIYLNYAITIATFSIT